MPSLTQRLDRIEEALSPSQVVYVWREQGETCEQARARLIRERPEAAGRLMTIVSWIDDRNSERNRRSPV